MRQPFSAMFLVIFSLLLLLPGIKAVARFVINKRNDRVILYAWAKTTRVIDSIKPEEARIIRNGEVLPSWVRPSKRVVWEEFVSKSSQELIKASLLWAAKKDDETFFIVSLLDNRNGEMTVVDEIVLLPSEETCPSLVPTPT